MSRSRLMDLTKATIVMKPAPDHQANLADPDVRLVDHRACVRCHHSPSA